MNSGRLTLFPVELIILEGLVEVDGIGVGEAIRAGREVELLSMGFLTLGAGAFTECGGEGAGEFSGLGDGGRRCVTLEELEAGRDQLTIFGRILVFFAGGSSDRSRICEWHFRLSGRQIHLDTHCLFFGHRLGLLALPLRRRRLFLGGQRRVRLRSI